MTSKKPSLSAALHEVARPRPVHQADAVEQVTTPSEARKPPSRRGLKAVSGHFDPAVSKQLRLLAVEEDTDLQALLAEAINDLFVKHNKNPIA